MREGFAKFYASMMRSSVWVGKPDYVKLTWVSILAGTDADGYVCTSIPGLAKDAECTIPEVEAALEIFLSPDPTSRTKDHEGRRIVKAERGWIVLNHGKYRASKSDGFAKIYFSMLRSTVWVGQPRHVKLTWLALLMLADADGYVGASIPGLAHDVGCSNELIEHALGILMSPDPYSLADEHEGRRIAEADGGWTILNHKKFREMKSRRLILQARRTARCRQRKAEEAAAQQAAESAGAPLQPLPENDGNACNAQKQMDLPDHQDPDLTPASLQAESFLTQVDSGKGGPKDLAGSARAKAPGAPPAAAPEPPQRSQPAAAAAPPQRPPAAAPAPRVATRATAPVEPSQRPPAPANDPELPDELLRVDAFAAPYDPAADTSPVRRLPERREPPAPVYASTECPPDWQPKPHHRETARLDGTEGFDLHVRRFRAIKRTRPYVPSDWDGLFDKYLVDERIAREKESFRERQRASSPASQRGGNRSTLQNQPSNGASGWVDPDWQAESEGAA